VQFTRRHILTNIPADDVAHKAALHSIRLDHNVADLCLDCHGTHTPGHSPRSHSLHKTQASSIIGCAECYQGLYRAAGRDIPVTTTQLLLPTWDIWRLATTASLSWGMKEGFCCVLVNAAVRILQTGCSIVLLLQARSLRTALEVRDADSCIVASSACQTL
jgi:hypothetical protein